MHNTHTPTTTWLSFVQTLARRYLAHRRSALLDDEADMRTWSLHRLRDIHAPEHVVRVALRYQETESYEQSKARLYWGETFIVSMAT